MVSYQRARRATKRRIEENALETLFEGMVNLDIEPKNLWERFMKKNKQTLKTNKKARQDLGKSAFGIIKDYLRI